jgi:hypothetical protein
MLKSRFILGHRSTKILDRLTHSLSHLIVGLVRRSLPFYSVSLQFCDGLCCLEVVRGKFFVIGVLKPIGVRWKLFVLQQFGLRHSPVKSAKTSPVIGFEVFDPRFFGYPRGHDVVIFHKPPKFYAQLIVFGLLNHSLKYFEGQRQIVSLVAKECLSNFNAEIIFQDLGLGQSQNWMRKSLCCNALSGGKKQLLFGIFA